MGSTENQIMPPFVNEEDDDQACLHAMVFTSSCLISMALNSAIELDLFGIIARTGPGVHVSPSKIAANLPIKNPDVISKLDRLLRLLVSHSFLTCSLQTLDDGSDERLYGLGPVGKLFVRNDEEGYLASLTALANHRAFLEVWFHMKDIILGSGDHYKNVHGMSIFQHMNIDPAFNRVFNQAMAGLSTIVMNKVLEQYEGFKGIKSLVDVAGGTGKCLNMIISKFPSIKGINFDMPHVTASAPSYPGIEHVGGDMFSSIPKGDALMVKDTCHNWSDELCIKLLKNCYQVLPKSGKLIIINSILPEVPESSMASKYVSGLDITMLISPSGKERTAKEFQALGKAAGFSNFKVACCPLNIWAVMELHK